jgi:nitrate reductase delta subunit
MHVAEVIALGYRYPTADSAHILAEKVEAYSWGVVQRHLQHFVDSVSELSLGEWEELHTATLDLSPKFVPYVGHVTWGKNYRRGEFMADLKRELAGNEVPLDGELPDHIEPILRYLAVEPHPMSDLVEVLSSSVQSMHKTLKQADPKNPYCELVAATAAFTADLRPLSIGERR